MCFCVAIAKPELVVASFSSSPATEVVAFGLDDLSTVIGTGGVAFIFLILSQDNFFYYVQKSASNPRPFYQKSFSTSCQYRPDMQWSSRLKLRHNVKEIHLESKCLNVEQDVVFIAFFEFKSIDSLKISCINDILVVDFLRYAP